ncbi:hypothetical protein V6N13_024926 [Hibiscus sabdariffa]|uniref:Uncharacterized protein n=1 Tax=Hibiscus sabdariffa TaxID=183260 RepID=A0ABR2QGP0_9ROSI
MWLIWFMLELMAIKGPEYTGVCWFRVMMVSGRQRVGELVAELVRAWEKIWENRNFKAHVGRMPRRDPNSSKTLGGSDGANNGSRFQLLHDMESNRKAERGGIRMMV